ncbi:MAG: glycerophosphodiester phosphodiesterase [Actinomycetota bacterium]|nr:glycerophosphodiester phosphodiesterase [Actinomycetota bacterium]
MANPWLERRILCYAHQGGAWEEPSSTMQAVRHALDVGATAIELDVHATADGHLVVSHDETVDRTTNGSGVIAELTLAEVQCLDAAYWFVPGADVSPGRPAHEYPLRGRAPADHDLRICTLAEILDAFPGVCLNLDIKQTAPDVEPYESALADLLRSRGRQDDVIVASFRDAATAAFSAYAPEFATSAGTNATTAFVRAVHSGQPLPAMPYAALQVPATFQGVAIVDEALVAAAHEAGLAVHVWTVNEQAEMESLVATGVDGIITDVPTTLATVLRRTGTAWER